MQHCSQLTRKLESNPNLADFRVEIESQRGRLSTVNEAIVMLAQRLHLMYDLRTPTTKRLHVMLSYSQYRVYACGNTFYICNIVEFNLPEIECHARPDDQSCFILLYSVFSISEYY